MDESKHSSVELRVVFKINFILLLAKGFSVILGHRLQDLLKHRMRGFGSCTKFPICILKFKGYSLAVKMWRSTTQ